MITLAIAAAFYYFTNQNYVIFNGHTGINSVVTPHFWGVDWRADIPFYYVILAGRGALLRRRLSRARAVRPGPAGRARQSAPHGRARLQRQRAPRRGLRLRLLHRRARRGAAGLELPADLAGLGRRRARDRHPHHRGRRRHHAPDRPVHRRADLRAAAHVRAGFPGRDRARRQPLPPADRSRLPRHRALLAGRRDRALGALART